MIIVGVDEVGRGCLAGPVVAAAVALLEPIPGLRDSKKLSKKQRETLDIVIREQALAIGIGWVDPGTIDISGITTAVKMAMEQAVAAITHEYDSVIVDGNYNYLPDNPKSQAVIRADDSVPAVSAASIVAKVARDNYMAEMAMTYPDYGFERHVGYGTAYHLQQLNVLGASDIHRISFEPLRSLRATASRKVQ
jgi:ribonuclease HII